MALAARFGMWHDCVSLHLSFKSDSPLRMELCSDTRELRVFEADDGYRAALHGVDEEAVAFPWRIDDFLCEREGFARCSMMDVRLEDDGPGSWVCVLPPDHELPWPVARDCEAYLRAEELMAECRMRKVSSEVAGERMRPPPAEVQRILTREMRLELFRDDAEHFENG